jgi:hypothetical protein
MPTPPGFADVSMQLLLAGFARPAYITFGVDPVATDPDLVAQFIVNAWTTAGSMNSRLDSTVTMREVIVRLGTDGGEDLLGSATNAVVGGLTGGAPPPNVAVLVHKRTARGGRRGRGRLFLPWFCSDNDTNEDGTLLPALVSSVQTAAGVWLAALATNDVPMYILHSPGQTAEGPPNEVTSLTVSSLVATQRRRLGR